MTISDPVLDTVNRRLQHIENQIGTLRADVTATIAERLGRERSADSPSPPPTRTTTKEVTITENSGQRMPAAATLTSGSVGAAADASGAGSIAHSRHHRTFDTIVSGRGLAVTGVLLMLIGSAFFLELSFTRGWIGSGERVVLGLLVGAAMVIAATRCLNGIYRPAAEAAIGLGAGIMYLSSWAAIALFTELHFSRAAAFAIMATVAAALTLIANRWRSQPVALLGLVGAYLTPLLLGHLVDSRTVLAAYLFIVTSGLLILARRHSFVAVEATAIVATLLFSPALAPDPFNGWSNMASICAASCFFALFATALSTRAIGTSAIPLAIIPFSAATVAYLATLEVLLNTQQQVLGTILLVLATVLLGVPRVVRTLPGELKPVYISFGLIAANLALRSLFHGTTLLDALSIEAAGLTILGTRLANSNVMKFGLALLALAGGDLLYNAATVAPAQQENAQLQSLFTPLMLSFGVWLSAAFAARRSIPSGARPLFSIIVHAFCLAGLTRATLDFAGGVDWNVALPKSAQTAISLIWALCGAALFVRGVTRKDDLRRWEGLALFAITTLKVFTIDLAALDLIYRIFAFLGTGGVLFISSAWYLRSLRSAPDQLENVRPIS